MSALGIVAGVATFVALLGLGEGAKRHALAQIEQLGMSNVIIKSVALTRDQAADARRRGSEGLAVGDGERLRQAIPAITRWTALRAVAGSVTGLSPGAAPQVVATGADFMRIYRVSLEAGRFITDDDVHSRAAVCVVGDGIARRLYGGADSPPALRIEGRPCRVIGALRRLGRDSGSSGPVALRDFDNIVIIPLGAELVTSERAATASEIVAEFRDPSDVIPSIPMVARILEIAHRGVEDYELVAPQQLRTQAERARRSLTFLIAAIATATLVAGGIGVMNTMLASVSERTREIGIRRAVGATRRDIALQFLVEAELLTAAGAGAGLVAGLLALVIAALAGWPVAMPAWILALPVGSAIAIGCACSAYPALAASRLAPVDALRQA